MLSMLVKVVHPLNKLRNAWSFPARLVWPSKLSPYSNDITLPAAVKVAVELNVPIPTDDVGDNPLAFHRILLPAVTVGVAFPFERVVQVAPLSNE